MMEGGTEGDQRKTEAGGECVVSHSQSNLLVSRDQRTLLIANEAIENTIRYADLTVVAAVQVLHLRGRLWEAGGGVTPGVVVPN